MKPNEYNKVQTASIAFIALIAAGFLLHTTRSFMVPFVIAVLLAFLLAPVADFLIRFKIPRPVANLLVILGFFVMLTGLVFVIYGASSSVTSTLPKYIQKYSNRLVHGVCDVPGSDQRPG